MACAHRLAYVGRFVVAGRLPRLLSTNVIQEINTTQVFNKLFLIFMVERFVSLMNGINK